MRMQPPSKGVSPTHKVQDVDIRQMNQLSNMMVSSIVDQMASTSGARSMLTQRLGYEYQGDRDVYTALGYAKELQFEDFHGKYKRGDISRRIIREPVLATWRSVPAVNETLPEEDRDRDMQRTAFETAWDELVSNKELKIWHNIRKADLISGIGRWGVIFLGFDDAADRVGFAEEVKLKSKLLYLTPLNESQSKVSSVVTNAADPRFGKPEFYELQFQSTAVTDTGGGSTSGRGASASQSIRVHWSRIIHIAEDADESGVVGTPRLEAVYNKLLDLDRIVGSSGEAFWRNAFPGMNFKLDKDFQTDEKDIDELRNTIDNFVHRWERHIRTKGITIEELTTSISSPKDSFGVVISIISSTTGIPQRILLGSERGQLASSQDQTQYGIVIQERRTQYVEPTILDQFILRMIMVGTLPLPKGNWSYVWANLFAPSEKERAEVTKNRTEALVRYADSMGASRMVPLSVFLRSEMFLGFSEDEAKKIEEMAADAAQGELDALADENNSITEEDEIIEDEV